MKALKGGHYLSWCWINGARISCDFWTLKTLLVLTLKISGLFEYDTAQISDQSLNLMLYSVIKCHWHVQNKFSQDRQSYNARLFSPIQNCIISIIALGLIMYTNIHFLHGIWHMKNNFCCACNDMYKIYRLPRYLYI